MANRASDWLNQAEGDLQHAVNALNPFFRVESIF
jgi:hypothetical protein